jgi:hypothetical protein
VAARNHPCAINYRFASLQSGSSVLKTIDGSAGSSLCERNGTHVWDCTLCEAIYKHHPSNPFDKHSTRNVNYSEDPGEMQQPYPVITPPRVGPEPENRHLFSEYHEPQTSYFQIDNDMIDSINGDEEFSNTMADYGLDPCDLLPCDPMAEETNEDDISSFTESNSAFSSPEIPASDHFQRHIYITENLMPTDGYQPTPIAGNTMHPVLMQENLCHAQGQATFIFTTTTPDIARQNSGYNDHGYSQTGPQNTFFPSDTTCGSPRVSPFTGTP